MNIPVCFWLIILTLHWPENWFRSLYNAITENIFLIIIVYKCSELLAAQDLNSLVTIKKNIYSIICFLCLCKSQHFHQIGLRGLIDDSQSL